MKRRWFGVVLMAWAFMAPLLALPQTAYAAGEIFTFKDATHIEAKGGDFDAYNPSTVTLAGSGTTFAGSTSSGSPRFPVPVTVRITGIAKDPSGGYKATVATNNGGPDGAIHIDDPKGVGPGGGSTPAPAPSPKAGSTEAVDCDAGPAFSWIICGGIRLMVGMIDTIRDDVIEPFLKEPPLNRNAPEFKDAYKIWSIFRNIASVFFILVFFFVIIGTALGFDNYSIKKILPHLVAGAILMPFSWYICAGMIDIGNVLGQGIVGLMSSIVPTPKVDFSTSFSAILLGGAGVVAFVSFGPAIAAIGAPMALSILIAFIGVFLTIVFRKILILLLVVISPFAMVAWVLPNTQKWFRMWWEDLFKLIMMYPIIMMLFEIGRLFSATAGAAGGGTGVAGGDWVSTLFAVMGLVLPLFAVPTAFKLAGRGFSAGAGAINRLSGSAQNRYGKNSQWGKDMADARERKNYEKSKQATDAAAQSSGIKKLGLKAKGGYNMTRAGLYGTGQNAKLRRTDATARIDKDLSTIDADEAKKKQADPETFDQRRKATTQVILEEKLKSQGTRQGIVDRINQSGGRQGNLLQRQARIDSRNQGLDSYGAAHGTIDEEERNNELGRRGLPGYVSPTGRIAAARDTTAKSIAASTGQMASVVQGAAEAEMQLQQANPTLSRKAIHNLRMGNIAAAATNVGIEGVVTAQQAANTNVSATAELDAKAAADHARLNPGAAPLTAAQARSQRLTTLAAATHDQEREKLGATEGDAQARARIRAAGGEERIDDLVSGEALASRERLGLARTLRGARTELQGTPEGRMSTADLLESSRLDNLHRVGTSIGASKQELAQHAEDAAAARRDGNPAPKSGDYVTAAQEAAKSRLAQDSAARRTAVASLAAGTAASTRQASDAAMLAAGKASDLANATMIGDANAANAPIDARARELVASGAAASYTLARRQAAQEVRAANRTAAMTTGIAAAESRSTKETNDTLGTADKINQEIDTETSKLLNAPGNTLTPAAARAEATRSVSRAQMSAVADSSRKAAGLAAASERETARGVQQNIDAQVNEEAERLHQENPALYPSAADAAGAARQNVRQNTLRGSGQLSRQQAAEADREAGATTIGAVNELNDAIDKQLAADHPGGIPAPGTPAYTAARDQAAAKVRNTRLSAAGTKAKTAAERAAQNRTSTNAGVERDMNEKIEEDAQTEIELAASTAAGVPMDPEMARERARAKMLAGTTTPANAAQRKAAEARVRQRDLQSIGTKTEQAAAHANQIETADALGVERAINSQINEEAARLEAGGMSAADAQAQASTNIRFKNLDAAGTAARGAAMFAARRANETNIGIVNDGTLRVKEKMQQAGLSQSEADLAARQEILDQVGTAARVKAEQASRASDSADIGAAQDVEAQIKEEADKLRAGGSTLSDAELRAQAQTNVREKVLIAVGNQSAADTARSNRAKVADALGTDNELNDKIEKQLLEDDPGAAALPPDNVARIAARDQAAAKVRNARLSAAGATSQSAAERKANDQAAKEAGIQTDINKEIDAELGKNAGKASAEQRQAAADRVRQRELAEMARQTEREAELANRKEVDAAIGANETIDGQTAKERKDLSQRIKEEADKIQRDNPGLSRSAARKRAVRIHNAAGPGGIAAQAAPNVVASNRSEASEATREAARVSQRTAQQGNKSVAENRATTLSQANANLARYEESAKAFKKLDDPDLYQKAADAEEEPAKIDQLADQQKELMKAELREKAEAMPSETPEQQAAKEAALAASATPDEAEARARAVEISKSNARIAYKQAQEAVNAKAKAAGDKAAKKAAERTYTTAEQQQAAYEIGAAGAGEAARISQASGQGQINAYAQAALAPNALNAKDRQIAATETAIVGVAEKAAQDRAIAKLRAPGEALNQTYLDTEAAAASAREEQLLRQAADLAKKQTFQYVKKKDGRLINTRIEGADMPNEAIDAVGAEIRRLMTQDPPQVDRAAALAQEIAKHGYGTQELRAIKNSDLFGGSSTQTVDEAKFGGKAKQYWDIFTSGLARDQAPDLFAPSVAIHDGVSGESLQKMNWRSIKAYLEYVTGPDIDAKTRGRLLPEAMAAIYDYNTNPQLSRNIDADRRKVFRDLFIAAKRNDRGHWGGDGDPETDKRVVTIEHKDANGNDVVETKPIEELWDELMNQVAPDIREGIKERLIEKKPIVVNKDGRIDLTSETPAPPAEESTDDSSS